jgi:hypothetical protein
MAGMAGITRLLLLFSFHLLSHAEAYRQRTSRGVKWLEKERSVLVRLQTPDLSLWNQDEQIGENIPSALIFNFTLTRDNRTLLLNGIPILPLENAHVPPRLNAHQTRDNLTHFEDDNLTDFSSCPLFSLDYFRHVPEPEDDSQVFYTYNPTLNLDILGASIAGYNALLPADTQHFISLTLKQLESPGTNPTSSLSFKIANLYLEDRDPYSQFKTPDSLQQCTIWSWLCSDVARYPWYQYIYRQNFDDYGKIGSLRHLIHARWANLLERLGVWKVVVLGFVVVSMVLSPVFYGTYRVWRRAQDLYRKRVEDVNAWTANEEIEGLLDADEEEAYDDGSKEEVELEKGEGSQKEWPCL